MLEEKHSVFCFRFPLFALPIQMNLDLGLGLGLGHRQFSSRQPQGLRIALSWITHRPPPPSPNQFPINHPSPGKSSQFRFTALHCPCCYLFSNSHSSTWHPTLCATATCLSTRPRIASNRFRNQQIKSNFSNTKVLDRFQQLTCKQKALRSRNFPDRPTSLSLSLSLSPPPPGPPSSPFLHFGRLANTSDRPRDRPTSANWAHPSRLFLYCNCTLHTSKFTLFKFRPFLTTCSSSQGLGSSSCAFTTGTVLPFD